MSEINKNRLEQGPTEEMADEALKNNFRSVADTSYDPQQRNAETEAMQGLAETHEQVSDDYVSGGNEKTFLREGKDLAKEDGFAPEV
ncbi:YozQ family protein [Paenibacillus thermotolerans]|uniref:YozQ family protein n=1 Tax=Paenibacillus thermotolerans TaxID=3027807 RepID=UPI002367DE0C|nr:MULTISPECIES: YozQ family protein [unclassified Paenibacillus]